MVGSPRRKVKLSCFALRKTRSWGPSITASGSRTKSPPALYRTRVAFPGTRPLQRSLTSDRAIKSAIRSRPRSPASSFVERLLRLAHLGSLRKIAMTCQPPNKDTSTPKMARTGFGRRMRPMNLLNMSLPPWIYSSI